MDLCCMYLINPGKCPSTISWYLGSYLCEQNDLRYWVMFPPHAYVLTVARGGLCGIPHPELQDEMSTGVIQMANIPHGSCSQEMQPG